MRTVARIIVAGLLAIAPLALGSGATQAAPAQVHGAVGFFLNYAHSRDSDVAVFKVQADGSGLHQILPKGTQTGPVGPDRKRFYFWQIAGSSGHTSIGSADLDGHHVRRLSSPTADEYNIGVAPNGKLLGFGQGLSPHDHLATSDINGRHVRAVPNARSGTAPAFFPDGQHVAYMRGVPGSCCLMYIIRVDGHAKRPIANGALGGWPVVSPDGRTVAFLLARGTPGTSTYRDEIAVQAATGGPVHHLTAAGTCVTPPQWSPDGQVLFFGKCMRQSNGATKYGASAIAEIGSDGRGLHVLMSHLNEAGGIVPIPAAVVPTPSAPPTSSGHPSSTPASPHDAAKSPSGNGSSRTGPIVGAVVVLVLAAIGSGYGFLRWRR